jgi:alpha-D-ribose 1-methylphosphonate 5-triphosphate synthase subunit PhnG
VHRQLRQVFMAGFSNNTQSVDRLAGNEAAVRRARMSVLARADSAALKEFWKALGPEPEHAFLRGPECGAVTLRGRMGGGGAPFNVGEVTITRATVRLANGAVGHSAILGRDREKAKIAALIDALASEDGALIEGAIIAPLRERLADADAKMRAQTAATRVDFFTMVRGED